MAQGKAYTTEQRETIIQSLKEYLELGLSRNKSCELIGLPPQTLSNWVQEDEALGMKLTGWENAINVIAIKSIKKAIEIESVDDKDIKKENSWKWAERKMKDDFSTRIENTGKDGKDLIPERPTQAEAEQLTSLLK